MVISSLSSSSTISSNFLVKKFNLDPNSLYSICKFLNCVDVNSPFVNTLSISDDDDDNDDNDYNDDNIKS